MIKSIPVYTSVLLRAFLSDVGEEVILAKDSRREDPPLWVHISSDNEYNTYPLRAFSCIGDFKDFIKYGSAHGK